MAAPEELPRMWTGARLRVVIKEARSWAWRCQSSCWDEVIGVFGQEKRRE